MVEREPHLHPHTDWTAVGQIPNKEDMAPVVVQFAMVSARYVKKEALHQNTNISVEALADFMLFYSEEVCDLTKALQLKSAPNFTADSTLSPEKPAYVALYEDGTSIIVLNTNTLLQAAKIFEARRHSEKTNVHPEPIMEVASAIAHEMGHIRSYQEFRGWLKTSAPKLTENKDPEDLHEYATSDAESYAESIAIRYLRRKKQVGSEVWQTMPVEDLAQKNLEIFYGERVLKNAEFLHKQFELITTGQLVPDRKLSRKLFLLYSQKENFEKQWNRIAERIAELSHPQ